MGALGVGVGERAELAVGVEPDRRHIGAQRLAQDLGLADDLGAQEHLAARAREHEREVGRGAGEAGPGLGHGRLGAGQHLLARGVAEPEPGALGDRRADDQAPVLAPGERRAEVVVGAVGARDLALGVDREQTRRVGELDGAEVARPDVSSWLAVDVGDGQPVDAGHAVLRARRRPPASHAGRHADRAAEHQHRDAVADHAAVAELERRPLLERLGGQPAHDRDARADHVADGAEERRRVDAERLGERDGDAGRTAKRV